MDIIQAAESSIKGRLDEYAFEINACLHNQGEKGTLDRLLTIIQKYAIAVSEMEVLTKIKAQTQTEPPTVTDEENEN
tara:strand:- start:1173 stop:1403 length:231 start_codon:yes stop_codon:yes gene_type:complete